MWRGRLALDGYGYRPIAAECSGDYGAPPPLRRLTPPGPQALLGDESLVARGHVARPVPRVDREPVQARAQARQAGREAAGEVVVPVRRAAGVVAEAHPSAPTSTGRVDAIAEGVRVDVRPAQGPAQPGAAAAAG